MKTRKPSFATLAPLTALSLIAVLAGAPMLPARTVDTVKPVLPQADVAKVPIPSVLALDPSEKVWALQVSDGSRLVVRNGDLVVNSSHTAAVWNADSTIQVLHGSLSEIGGYHPVGRAITTPAPQTIEQTGEDPIPPLTIAPPEIRSNEKLFLQDNNDTTLLPGTYNGGIFATGKKLHITLAPGTYVLNDGDFLMSGCSVTGKGVTLVLAGPQAGTLKSNDAASIDLAAPSEGELKGIVVVSRATGDNKIQLSNTRARFIGTIYAPNAGVKVTENAVISATRVICLNLGVNVSSFLEIYGDDKVAADSDPPAPQPQADAAPANQ